MSRRMQIAWNMHGDIGDEGVAELVFGPLGGMPGPCRAGHSLDPVGERTQRALHPGAQHRQGILCGRRSGAGARHVRQRIAPAARDARGRARWSVAAKAREVVHTLAAASPTVLAFTNRRLNHWLRAAWPTFEHSLSLEMLRFAAADAHQGFPALKETRQPQFETP